MTSPARKIPSLAELEEEVLIEGREWMRARLEQRLQAEADRLGAVSPPEQPPDAPVVAGDERR